MALLYMIRYEMQDDALFYLALRNFLERYANDVATGMDFKEVLEETSGMDFTDFFDQWYFGAGFPIYEVDWEQQGDQLTIHSTQSTSSTQTPLFKMSMEYTVYHTEGDTTVRVFHDEHVERFQFQIPFTVTGIGIDTRNHVLDGQQAQKRIALRPESPKQFSIAPNPSNGTFFFSLDPQSGNLSGRKVQVEVVDLSGRTIFRELYESCLPYMDYEVKVKDAPRGVYVTRFSCDGSVEIHKILVK
jgi:hypothetical protein